MTTLISKVSDYDNRVWYIIVVSESHCLHTLRCWVFSNLFWVCCYRNGGWI